MRAPERKITLRFLLVLAMACSILVAVPSRVSASGEGGNGRYGCPFPVRVTAQALAYIDLQNGLYCGTATGFCCQTPGSGTWTWMDLEGTEVLFDACGFGSLHGRSHVSFGTEKTTNLTSWSDGRIVCRVPALPGADVPVATATSLPSSPLRRRRPGSLPPRQGGDRGAQGEAGTGG